MSPLIQIVRESREVFLKFSFTQAVAFTLVTVLIFKFAVLIYTTESKFSTRGKAKFEQQHDTLRKRVDEVAIKIDDKLSELKRATNIYYEDISNALQTGKLGKLDSISEAHYEKNIMSGLSFFGLGYCLDFSGSEDPDSKNTKSLFVRATPLDNPYTYTSLPITNYDFWDKEVEDADWYHDLVNETNINGKWVEPYYGDNAKTVLAEYGRRISVADSVRGIVYFDYSLYDVKRIVESSLDNLPKTIFGYILSKDGKMVYHPNNSLWKRPKLLDISYFGQNQNDDCNLCRFSDYIHCLTTSDTSICNPNFDFEEGEMSTYNFNDRDQKDARIFKKINSTDWYFVMIYPDYEEDLSNDEKRKLLMNVLIVFLIIELALLTFLLIYLVKSNKVSHRKLKRISLYFSIILIIDFTLICTYSYTFPSNLNIQDDINKSYVKHEDCAHSIVSKSLAFSSPEPTNFGLKIDVLSIRNAHELQIAGFYWMRRKDSVVYNKTLEDERAFVAIKTEEDDKSAEDPTRPDNETKEQKADVATLPELHFPDLMENRTATSFAPTSFVRNGDSITYRRFEVVLKQNFDYSRFPFDNQVIKVRLRHKDFWNKQFLIPDFRYMGRNKNNKSERFANSADLEEWNLVDTYFTYELKDYTNKSPFVKNRQLYYDSTYCNYPMNDSTQYASLRESFNTDNTNNIYPELQFILEIKRQYFRPLIAFLLPVVVILILLYFYVTRIETYRPGSFLDEGATLLFTLLLSHFALREFLPFKGLIYIEFFYFIVYLAIIIYIINRNIYFAYTEKKRMKRSGYVVKAIVWEKNLVAVVSFWPVTFLLFIAISLGFFY